MVEKKVCPDRFVGYKFVGRGDVGTLIKYDGSFNRAGFVTMLLINPTIFYPRHTSEVIGR